MKIKVSLRAINDIAEIHAYIHDEYGNPAAAERIVDKIVKSYKQLKTSPYIGKPLKALIDYDSDYRFLVCGDYLIIYKPDENANMVIVRRVIHSKRDFFRLIHDRDIAEDAEETALLL